MRTRWLLPLLCCAAGCVSTPVSDEPLAAEPDGELTAWHQAANVATAPFRLLGAAVYYPVRFVAYDAWVGLYDLVAGEPAEVAAFHAAATPAERARTARAAAAAGHTSIAPELVALLADEDERVRAAAVDGLTALRAGALAPDLLRLMDAARDPAVALAAAEALGGVGTQAPWPALAERVRNPAGPMQAVAAAHALGRMAAPQGCWALVAALEDPRAPVRQQAAWALGRLGDRRAAPFCVPLLDDASVEVRATVMLALGRLGYDGIAPRLTAWLRRTLPADSAPQAYEALAAVNALGRLGTSAVVGDLEALATAAPTDRPWDGPLRAAAAQALARCDAERALAVLAPLLADADARVSRTAGLVLGALGATDVLVAALDDPHARTREAAAIGLGRLGTPRAAAVLWERGGTDVDGVVRHATARALLALGDRRGLDLLVDEVARGTRNLESRAAALRVLQELAGSDLGLEPAAWRAWRRGAGERVDLAPFRYGEG